LQKTKTDFDNASLSLNELKQLSEIQTSDINKLKQQLEDSHSENNKLKNQSKELDGKLSELTINLENIKNEKDILLKKIKKKKIRTRY